jgi:hypothetical protein
MLLFHLNHGDTDDRVKHGEDTMHHRVQYLRGLNGVHIIL